MEEEEFGPLRGDNINVVRCVNSGENGHEHCDSELVRNYEVEAVPGSGGRVWE